ncbi:MAG TPA: cell wall hydrolase [Allosphingosinicella sp.]|jgi:hypothetical protein
MFNMFRVAGLAAAAALLCASPTAAAAAEATQTSPATNAAAAIPVTKLDISAPAVNADQAVLSTFPATPAIAEHSSAATALTPGRIRPDRPILESSPFPVPGPGVNGGANGSVAGTARRPLADLVVEHARAETGDEQFECLARAVYFESRGEPIEGQLAVAEVILNRVRSGRFRATICDVVKQPSQFSFVRRGVIPEVPRESAVWRRSVAIAHIALQDLANVTGEESLFFHATYVNPRWGRPRIARIGNHIFYR